MTPEEFQGLRTLVRNFVYLMIAVIFVQALLWTAILQLSANQVTK